MRGRAALALLFGLWAWADACTPQLPDPALRRAAERLQGALTGQRCTATKSGLTSRCYRQYPLTAAEVVKLSLTAEPGGTARRVQQHWQLRWPARTGVTATVHPLPGGSVVATIDRQTAFESLEEVLREAGDRRPKALPIRPEHCRTLGLADTPHFTFSRCGVVTGQAPRPTLWVQVASTSDQTLQAGRFYTYMPFGPDCQGGTVNAVSTSQ